VFAKLLDAFGKGAPNDWVDLGLGRAVDPATGNTVLFKVLQWPAANAVRHALGLPPQHFHITVAFQRYDMHGITKDHTTLIPALAPATATPTATTTATTAPAQPAAASSTAASPAPAASAKS
jgi:hypothetical protein